MNVKECFRSTIVIMASVAGSVALALTGCNNSIAPTAITLGISDLLVPATVTRGATIPIDATVQYGGCESFTKLDIARSSNQITVTARGENPNDPGITCIDILHSVKKHVDVAAPPTMGTVTITAAEPVNATPVVRQVQIQ